MKPENDVLGYSVDRIQTVQLTLKGLKEVVGRALKHEASSDQSRSSSFFGELQDFISALSEQMEDANDRLQGFDRELSKRVEERQKKIGSYQEEMSYLEAMGGESEEMNQDSSQADARDRLLSDLSQNVRSGQMEAVKKLEQDIYHSTRRVLEFVTNPRFRTRTPLVEVTPEFIQKADNEMILALAREAREDLIQRSESLRAKIFTKGKLHAQLREMFTTSNSAASRSFLENIGKKLDQVSSLLIGSKAIPQSAHTSTNQQFSKEFEKQPIDREALNRVAAQVRSEMERVQKEDRKHDLRRAEALGVQNASLTAMLGQTRAQATMQKFAANKQIGELEGLLAGQVEASKLFREKVVLEIGKMQGEAKEKNKQAVATQAEVQTKDAEIAKLRAQLTSLEAERDAANSRTAAAETLVHEKEAATESAEGTQLRLQNAEGFIKRLVKKLSEKKDELTFLREQIELIKIAYNEQMGRLEKSNKQVISNKDVEIKTLRDTVARLSEHVQDLKTEIARLSKLLGLENEARASAEKRAAGLAQRQEQLELEMNEFAAVEVRKKLLALIELGRSLELSGDDFFRLLSNVVPESVLDQLSRLIIDRNQTRMIFDNPFAVIEEIVNDRRFTAEFAETKLSFRRGLVLEETLEIVRLSFRKIHPPKGGVCDMEKEDRNELALEYLRERLSARAFKDLEDKILQKYNSRGHMDWSLKRIENFRTVVSHALLAEIEDMLSPLLNERRVIR